MLSRFLIFRIEPTPEIGEYIFFEDTFLGATPEIAFSAASLTNHTSCFVGRESQTGLFKACTYSNGTRLARIINI